MLDPVVVSAMVARARSHHDAVVQHGSHIYDQLGLAPNEHDHRRVLAVARYLAR